MKLFIIQFLILVFVVPSYAEKIIPIPRQGDRDMTPVIREAIENANDKEIKLVFEEGKYYFQPDFAYEKYCPITNHKNGIKRIAFPFENFEKVTIEGKNTELIFNGQMFPFLIENCQNVSIKNIKIDWKVPFTIQGTVVAVNEKEKWMDVVMDTEGYSFQLRRGQLQFPNIKHFTYSSLGNTLTFDPKTKAVAHGGLDLNGRPEKVEHLEGNKYRFHGPMRQFPTLNNKINFKGPHGDNRYAPAFQMISSKDISFDNVVVHHALGMGFLAERSENVTLKNSGVYTRKDSDRLISSTADATHFCNVKGKVLVENCRFENMLDDATNVHGTYVSIDKVVNKRSVIVKLEHYQQYGFQFAGKGDEIWWIHQPSPDRQAKVLKVASYKELNEEYTQLTFENDLPSALKSGDLMENKTWNPEFVMRGCTMQNHRARNIVLKTPEKIVIEENYFSSSMSAVFFRGESFHWFESGQVEDVLIQNNTFYNCATSGMEHAVLYITPRLGKATDKKAIYDRNIRFINNKINTFDSRIVWAYNVDGLLIKGNEIIKNNELEELHPDRPIFEFNHCKNVEIGKNKIKGFEEVIIKEDGQLRDM
ncbi:alpha-1,3-galactosidase-related protein [Flammeovirga aprica]|uniref:Right-handed parallel beta-helix repeat-containing protein n=1 Tax=Flammeovirga aprica JL-4 TaxID=694437 RepID=A0A7X9RX82_9BACT|nr:right-handed parallel beta-helix repeat-containing protein [Flammeovirga aprica]NME70443.1 right-handed parallel beta-helix repeat-containing protein [Flammeovirga aprica JL-4]